MSLFLLSLDLSVLIRREEGVPMEMLVDPDLTAKGERLRTVKVDLGWQGVSRGTPCGRSRREPYRGCPYLNPHPPS